MMLKHNSFLIIISLLLSLSSQLSANKKYELIKVGQAELLNGNYITVTTQVSIFDGKRKPHTWIKPIYSYRIGPICGERSSFLVIRDNSQIAEYGYDGDLIRVIRLLDLTNIRIYKKSYKDKIIVMDNLSGSANIRLFLYNLNSGSSEDISWFMQNSTISGLKITNNELVNAWDINQNQPVSRFDALNLETLKSYTYYTTNNSYARQTPKRKKIPKKKKTAPVSPVTTLGFVNGKDTFWIDLKDYFPDSNFDLSIKKHSTPGIFNNQSNFFFKLQSGQDSFNPLDNSITTIITSAKPFKLNRFEDYISTSLNKFNFDGEVLIHYQFAKRTIKRGYSNPDIATIYRVEFKD